MPDPQESLVLSPAVETALKQGLPVVALESTVITHGLPWPQNLSVFRALEEILVNAGVTPATIIVLNGKAQIGVDEDLIHGITPLLKQPGSFGKLGTRDLPLAFARGHSGGTTVSATMRLASLAGIEVFATGGIGGAHRGWEKTLDISSDLTALASFPVAVVSAGCKAILDVGATLEYLETLAVPVLGWQTDRFPLFYTTSSEHWIERLDSTEDFARLWSNHQSLGGKGLLIANPIPEAESIAAPQIEAVINSSLIEARLHGVSGKALTPFLLDYLARATKGDSVRANLALLQNNARVAAELAKALKHRG